MAEVKEEKKLEATPEELEAICPLNPLWAGKMISMIGPRGKLAPLAKCPSVKAVLEKIKKGLL